MNRVLARVNLPVGLFSVATLATIVGLAVRSCHPASESLMIPLCSGQHMMLETGKSAIVHCAGCYAALFGMIGMAMSGTWGFIRSKV